MIYDEGVGGFSHYMIFLTMGEGGVEQFFILADEGGRGGMQIPILADITCVQPLISLMWDFSLLFQQPQLNVLTVQQQKSSGQNMMNDTFLLWPLLFY